MSQSEKPSIPFNFLKKSLPILLSLSCIGCVNQVDTSTRQQSNYQSAPTLEQITFKKVRLVSWEGGKQFTTTSGGLTVTFNDKGFLINGASVNTLANNPCDVAALEKKRVPQILINLSDVNLLTLPLDKVRYAIVSGNKIVYSHRPDNLKMGEQSDDVIFIGEGDNIDLETFNEGTLVITGGIVHIHQLGAKGKAIIREGKVKIDDNQGSILENRK